MENVTILKTIEISLFLLGWVLALWLWIYYKNLVSSLGSAQELLDTAKNIHKRSSEALNEARKQIEMQEKNFQSKKQLMIDMQSEISSYEEFCSQNNRSYSDYIASYLDILGEKGEHNVLEEELRFMINLMCHSLSFQSGVEKIKLESMKSKKNYADQHFDLKEDSDNTILQNIEELINLMQKKIYFTDEAIANIRKIFSSKQIKPNCLNEVVNIMSELRHQVTSLEKILDSKNNVKEKSGRITEKIKINKEDAEKFKNNLDKIMSMTESNEEELSAMFAFEEYISKIDKLSSQELVDDSEWIDALSLIPEKMNKEEQKIWSKYYDAVKNTDSYKNFNSERYSTLNPRQKWVFNSIIKIENSLKNAK